MEIAKKCFEENVNRFTDPKVQTEKFNLYNGLFNLTTELKDELRGINNKIDALGQAINTLQVIIQNRS